VASEGRLSLLLHALVRDSATPVIIHQLHASVGGHLGPITLQTMSVPTRTGTVFDATGSSILYKPVASRLLEDARGTRLLRGSRNCSQTAGLRRATYSCVSSRRTSFRFVTQLVKWPSFIEGATVTQPSLALVSPPLGHYHRLPDGHVVHNAGQSKLFSPERSVHMERQLTSAMKQCHTQHLPSSGMRSGGTSGS